LVSPPPAGLAGFRRGGELNLCVEVLVKVIFFNRLSWGFVAIFNGDGIFYNN
jgi:hypothetical protein